MESVCSFGGWWVYSTRPVLESVRLFVGREVLDSSKGCAGETPNLTCNSLIIQLVASLSYTPRAEICLVVRRVRSLSYSPHAGICQVVRLVCLVVRWAGSSSYTPRAGFCLLHAPCWNVSGRSSGGKSLLYTPSWNVSGRSSGGESLLHVLCRNLSRSSVER